ncbi:putative metallopeptidase [Acetomicrobium sp.]|uniref:putative metallopeptidase n=1 Tax=Acetomicrobium sp. TaxID=1872099 RepID=UPI001BCC76A8|nr:putative metallopeptidase [Acetomicrobium sp.]
MLTLELAAKLGKGKNRVACVYRRAAWMLVKKFDMPANPDEILFLVDNVSKRAKEPASIWQLPEWAEDVIYQITGVRLKFAIKLRLAMLDRLPPSAVTAVLYHQLRHIKEDADGTTYLDMKHDVEDFSELLPFRNYIYGADIPNLLDVDPAEIFADMPLQLQLGVGESRQGQEKEAADMEDMEYAEGSPVGEEVKSYEVV